MLDSLVARADVFVQNLAPGTLERAGPDPARWRARDPRLIVCSISGYGRGGPYEHRKAYNLLVQWFPARGNDTGWFPCSLKID